MRRRSSSDESLPIPRRHRRALIIIRDVAASLTAILAYVLAALCVGWVASMLLAPLGYVWPRFALEAAISTGLGMLASWRLTHFLFPGRSGKMIVATFAGAVAIVFLVGWNGSINGLHTGQASLLVVLAYGLFWPHRKPAR